MSFALHAIYRSWRNRESLGTLRGLWGLFSNLAHLMELSVARKTETASRFDRAQSALWAHLARERGNLQPVKDVLITITRDRPHICVSDQSSEFNERGQAQDGRSFFFRSGRCRRPNHSPSRKRHDSSARVPKRGRNNRSKYPDASNAAKDAKYNSSRNPREDNAKNERPKGT